MPCLQSTLCANFNTLLKRHDELVDAPSYAVLHDVGIELYWIYSSDDIVTSATGAAFDECILSLWSHAVGGNICRCTWHQKALHDLQTLSADGLRAQQCLAIAGAHLTLVFGGPLCTSAAGRIRLSHLMPLRIFIQHFIAGAASEVNDKVRIAREYLRPTSDTAVASRSAKRARRELFTGRDPVLRLSGDFKRFGRCQTSVTFAVPTDSLDASQWYGARFDIDGVLMALGIPFHRSAPDCEPMDYVEVQYTLPATDLVLPTAVEARGGWLWLPARETVGSSQFGVTRELRESLKVLREDGRVLHLRMVSGQRRRGLHEAIHRAFSLSPDVIDDLIVWRQPTQRHWIEYAKTS